jgi:pimeloyl-ACP methyl ester carboxylesterase
MIYSFGDYQIDTGLYELRLHGKPLPVEPQVFDLLVCLIENRDRVVSKDDLFETVWQGRIVSEASLSSRINAARTALGDSGSKQKVIQTVPRRGFRFVAPIEAKRQDNADAAGAPAPPPAKVPDHQNIQFCTTADGTRIAYSTAGAGPPLVKAPNWMSHLEYEWESPIWRHFMMALCRHNTLVRFDQRGNGLSDWNVKDISFDAFVDDLETVVDSLDLKSFPLVGVSQGCAISVAYAVRHPERVSHLILYGGFTRGAYHRDKTAEEQARAALTLIKHGWGQDNPAFRQMFTSGFMPDATREQWTWFNDLQRISASAENAVRLRETVHNSDISDMLAKVSVPSLVVHCRGDAVAPFEEGRRLAAMIPNARFVPLEGNNHLMLEDEPAWPRFLQEMRDFLR